MIHPGTLVSRGRRGTYTGEPLIRFPWTWSMIEPRYRFTEPVSMVVDDPRRPGPVASSSIMNRGTPYIPVPGVWVIATPDEAIWHCLGLEYERQVRAELVDPEWPCEYYERMMENRD